MSIIKKRKQPRHAAGAGASAAIHPLYTLRPLLGLLEAAGVTPEAALRGVGVLPSVLEQPYALLSQRQMITVYDNVLALAPADTCALTLGLSCRLSDLGLYGYALHSSARLRDGCAFALRHRALALPMTELALAETDQEACWTIGLQADVTLSSALRQFVLGYQSGLLMAIHRQMTPPSQGGFRLTTASLACPPPRRAAAYHTVLGCPIAFNAAETRLHFSAAWLDLPPPGAHALTFRLLADACDALRHRAGAGGDLVDVIEGMLLNQPARLATIDQMAARLQLHPRTLRRRLAQQGVSYRDIVDQVRFQLAARYLADPALTHEAISEKLGFSDASSFRRAFKRWSRLSPKAFRHGDH
ncbi:helix-turn-helix domain-containing protein [Pseudoduganella sp. FT25W]|uniref:Helix-turn-helix domain-containing protein n=1 Tax=Duganella alba TaxID=2666081 RepID=A0A6L5QDM2_9BURK|nr:AraC family transcriptional regulator [Duganella alba]MRX07382.1 helix-turn-helix domain-containing protein [Duganella alba]MRX19484.1 helix-turn-helix domain-containing protein [Duganella alba]